MPLFILIPVFAIGGIIVLILLLGGVAQSNKQVQLLGDLGLKNRWWGGKTTAFYKWSWRKTSKERVWGERIVKESFKKARVWLTLDDFSYFEQKCDEYQKYRKVNDQQIIERIEQTVRRTEELENSIRQQVKDLLHRIVSTSDSEAKRFLQESGINLEGKDRILQRYGGILIRKLADHIGYIMLGHHAAGEDTKALSNIQGIEGWDRWLTIYKQTLVSEASKGVTSSNQAILEGIVSSLRGGLLKDYEQDILSHKAFLEAMDKQCDDKHCPIKPDQVESLECILYSWQFNNEVRFNNADHNRVRQFLSRTDLSARFRAFVFQNIHGNMDSLQSLIDSMPRNIVFYGKNGFARAYAADQYHLHLERFLEVFAKLVNKESNPPGILTITETEIDKRRKEISADSRGQVLQGKGMNVVDTSRQSIEEIVLRKKERSIEKRNIDMETADQRGWLIDFPWDEQNVEVFGIFRNEPFHLYTPFNCDNSGNVDFLSNNLNAKRQRGMFFDSVLDSLLKVSPFQLFAESSL